MPKLCWCLCSDKTNHLKAFYRQYRYIDSSVDYYFFSASSPDRNTLVVSALTSPEMSKRDDSTFFIEKKAVFRSFLQSFVMVINPRIYQVDGHFGTWLVRTSNFPQISWLNAFRSFWMGSEYRRLPAVLSVTQSLRFCCCTTTEMIQVLNKSF